MKNETNPEARDAAAALSSVLDDLLEGVQIIDFEWRYVYLNKAAGRHGRRAREELIGRTMTEAYPGIDATPVFAALQRCMTERAPQQMVNRFTYPDGRASWFDLRVNAVPMGILVLSVDVTAQKEAELLLRQSREDLATTLDCMADAVIATDRGGLVTRINPAAREMIGWGEEEARGRPLDEMVRFVDQRTGEPLSDPVRQTLGGQRRIGAAGETRLVGRGGATLPVAASAAPLRDADGTVRGVVLVLKNMKVEHELTLMLQQSQKMEAIGQLAGGVAHDFNNLLTVIAAHGDMLLGEIPATDPIRGDVEEIRSAADRAASLTRQLLAFSRKQVLQPEVVALDAVVEGMEPLLRRLIGEHIELVTDLKPGLVPVLVDPGQVEQVVMNLALNARDAMPDGGTLIIESANVELDDEYARSHPGALIGPHAMIAVTDTGAGMDAATRARIFEPFFTTKETGKGTGLGLAMVYGIVKQSGGDIWVYSEPGRGTTLKIYFPRADVEPAAAPAAASAPGPVRGAGTILLVEDDDAVRRAVRRMLERGGYTVLDTGRPQEAIERCARAAEPIDLLLTDVVMPGMNGREMVERILAVRPGIRVVYMSGYTDDAIVHHGVLDPGTAFIEKPITADLLLRTLRRYLVDPPRIRE